MNTRTKGYLIGAVAAAAYGMNPLFALPLYADGMTPASVLLFRYLVAIAIIWCMIHFEGGSFATSRRNGFQLVVMGVLMAISSITLFASYRYMDAGIASTLLFVYPILVAVIMAVFFREKATASMTLCIVLAIAGIGLLYKASDGTTIDATGTALVMVSALSYAIYIVAVNQTSLRSLSSLVVTFYVLVYGAVLLAGMALADGSISRPGHWYMWGNVVALALFPTAISFAGTTKAIQYVGSTPTAVLGALEPLTAVFFGVTVFGEKLTVRDCIGIVLIITAVTIVVTRRR